MEARSKYGKVPMKVEIGGKVADFTKVYEEQDRLLEKHGVPKIGRWVYCKYCYKNVCPEINYQDGLIKCTECGYGLAPLGDVAKEGSYQRWHYKVELDWTRYIKYLEGVRNGTMKPTGKDEFGDVPYICDKCKARSSTVYSSRGHLCGKCDENEKNKK